jgi:hypothetical protein
LGHDGVYYFVALSISNTCVSSRFASFRVRIFNTTTTGSGDNSRTSHLFIAYGASESFGTEKWVRFVVFCPHPPLLKKRHVFLPIASPFLVLIVAMAPPKLTKHCSFLYFENTCTTPHPILLSLYTIHTIIHIGNAHWKSHSRHGKYSTIGFVVWGYATLGPRSRTRANL